MQKTIDMPVSLIGKISKAARAFEDLEDDMEDFLFSMFIKRMLISLPLLSCFGASPQTPLNNLLCEACPQSLSSKLALKKLQYVHCYYLCHNG